MVLLDLTAPAKPNRQPQAAALTALTVTYAPLAI
jgi:hypothetical protein